MTDAVNDAGDSLLFDAPEIDWRPFATITETPKRAKPRPILDIERSTRGSWRLRTYALGKAQPWQDTSAAWIPLMVQARCSGATGTLGCAVAGAGGMLKAAKGSAAAVGLSAVDVKDMVAEAVRAASGRR